MFPISLRGCACLALLLLAVPAMAQPSRIPATLPAVLDWTAAHHPALQRMTHELRRDPLWSMPLNSARR